MALNQYYTCSMIKALPQELQSNIKSLRVMAIVMALCGAITIIGVLWAFVYVSLAITLNPNKVPNRKFLAFVAIITIPACIFIAPIFFEIALWRMINKAKKYETAGQKGFRSNDQWKAVNFWNKYSLVTGMLLTISLMLIMVMPVRTTTSKVVDIPHTVQYIQEASLELGESQIKQPGTKGQGLEQQKQTKPLFAFIFGNNSYYSAQTLPTQTTHAPINQIVAQGTKKYQYMWCSNGTYRYFTNEQFRDSNTGFTHKSEDECNKSGNGHMSKLSDSAPPQQATTVYQATPRYSPTYTTCREYSYINQFSCTTY